MKQLWLCLFPVLLSGVLYAGGITVQKTIGDVKVRQGVTEVWNAVAAGDVLQPHDTMRTGSNGSAVLVVQFDERDAAKRISLPAQVIVDMSDIRSLTQEELMLKLTMEKVRSSSNEWKNDELRIPNAAVVHGAEKTTGTPVPENDRQVGQFLLNGVRVLFDNGFYATTVLRSMEVFRMYPSLSTTFEHRLLLAQAMERANLRGEALAEYSMLLRMEGLTATQMQLVQGRMEALRAERR